MEEARTERHGSSRRLLVVIVIIVVLVGATVYFVYSVTSPGEKCVYVPGRELFLRVLSDATGQGLGGLSVNAQLINLCPIGGTGNFTPTRTTVGSWSFTTNGTGYVSAPSSELAGRSLSFTVAVDGTSYSFYADICGNGTTIVELRVPSATFIGRELGSNGMSVSDNGSTQMILSCSASTFIGNATRS